MGGLVMGLGDFATINRRSYEHALRCHQQPVGTPWNKLIELQRQRVEKTDNPHLKRAEGFTLRHWEVDAKMAVRLKKCLADSERLWCETIRLQEEQYGSTQRKSAAK